VAFLDNLMKTLGFGAEKESTEQTAAESEAGQASQTENAAANVEETAENQPEE
jgi:hypothetical protein